MTDVSDPGAIRALAHPLRLRLLQALAVRITAIATEPADDVGESPSNCSFHLRKLAEFGYIDRADDATGRDKPWRISDPMQNLLPDPEDPAVLEASRATGAATFEWDVATLRAGHARRNAPEWRGTTLQSGSTLIVTPEEARAVNGALIAVLEPYFVRLTDHRQIPSGAGVIRLMMASTYLPEHQALIDSETGAGGSVAVRPPGFGRALMRDLLRVPHFRRLLSVWTIGNFADSALFLTLAVWAKDLTGSSGAAGMVFFCLGLPVLLAPLIGLLADRVRRRPLSIASNLCAAAAVLALLGVRTADDVWLLYAVTFLYGALGTINGAAQSGLLRTMPKDEHLGTANAAFMTIDKGLRVLTPIVGAALYAGFGGPQLAGATSVLLTITVLGLLTVRIVEPRPERADVGEALTDSGFRALAAAFAHLRRTPVLVTMVVGLRVSLGVIGMYDSLLFAVVEHGLHRKASFFGVLMSAQGAGSIIGGVTAAWLLRTFGPLRAVGAALALIAVAGTGLLVLKVVVVLIGSALAGVAIPWAFVALATTRQRLTPPALQGRSAAATNVSLQLPQLVATATGAALVGAVDYRLLTIIASAVIATAALWVVVRARTSAQEVAVVAPAASSQGDVA